MTPHLDRNAQRAGAQVDNDVLQGGARPRDHQLTELRQIPLHCNLRQATQAVAQVVLHALAVAFEHIPAQPTRQVISSREEDRSKDLNPPTDACQ